MGHGTVRCLLQGSTSNYIINWKDDSQLSCSCPDFIMCKREGMLCKHCCYVILGLSVDDDDLSFFIRLMSSQRAEEFARKQKQFLVQQTEWQGKERPICYDGLELATTCHKCPSCNVVLHTDCIRKCLQHDARCP